MRYFLIWMAGIFIFSIGLEAEVHGEGVGLVDGIDVVVIPLLLGIKAAELCECADILG
jgi:hypothetical protein